MEVLAYLNHGRWIVDCPKCGKVGATLAEPNHLVAHYSAENGLFICHKCYPGMIVRSGVNANGSLKFNATMRAVARQKAEKNGEIYRVIFPENRKEIELAVAKRAPDNQNWEPGETIEFLLEENQAYGVK
ncbi:MAG: hypothetical protein CVU43_09750 [Chloroflexi bacterium HGW-Chloroflexi-5]|jgi:hypothetical protein|nr:MAG: hypothetical protein CVU43_09750 [Chloroflexi bacterium HGW-Chloroflexi-5]